MKIKINWPQKTKFVRLCLQKKIWQRVSFSDCELNLQKSLEVIFFQKQCFQKNECRLFCQLPWLFLKKFCGSRPTFEKNDQKIRKEKQGKTESMDSLNHCFWKIFTCNCNPKHCSQCLWHAVCQHFSLPFYSCVGNLLKHTVVYVKLLDFQRKWNW